MAYVNPYANTMNYKPRSLWTQPERPRTDWSTFWGKADEDEDEKDKDDGRGDETGVEKGAGSQLKSLWGDVMADMQQNMQSGYDLQQSENMFNNLFGPGITATNEATVPNTTDYVSGWQNPNYTGPQLDTDFITDVSLPANYTGAQTTPTGIWDTDFISNIPDWRDMVGQGGLTQRQSAQSFANAPTVTYGNTGATNPTLGEVLNGYTDPETGAEIDFDAVTDEERDWGDFW